jgi:phage terminase large subunit
MPAVQTRDLRIRTPRVFLPLLKPSRYKGAWGGRGSGKSHAFADLLIERCLLRQPCRAVCVREFQRSLEQSVKRLLEDKIQAYELGKQFRVLNTHIETPGDGIIIFNGMQSHTAESIKSLEAYDVAWVEEAQSLSQRSLDLLRPTIREKDSEIWLSWNPRFATDPVDKLLRGDQTPPDVIVVNSSYRDNPFFPDVLKREMEWDRARDPEKYAHVWMGEYERHSESRVFKNWVVEDFETESDASFLYGADWGYSVDPSVLVRCYVGRESVDATTGKVKLTRKLYIDREAYRIGVEIDHLPQLFDTVPGARDWAITADSARPETISYLNRNGFPKIVAAIKGKDSVKEGVIFLQGYDIVVHPRCVHTIDELTMYSFKTDTLTGMVTPVLEDKKNHVIDSLRYAVERLRANVFDYRAAGMTSEVTW